MYAFCQELKEKDMKGEYVVIKKAYLVEGEGRTYRLELKHIPNIDASIRNYDGGVMAYMKLDNGWVSLTHEETMYILFNIVFEFLTKSVHVGGI
jgi:hypothetical protein